jgi:uncharacterized protein with HEPN domain
LKRDPRKLLWDAHRAAGHVVAFARGKTFEDFESDLALRSAVERQLEIVGEALAQLAKLDPAMAARIPDWREIVAFRNILIHGYALIDNARVWRVIREDVPRLIDRLAELIGPTGA